MSADVTEASTSSPTATKHRRASSSATGVLSEKEIVEGGIALKLDKNIGKIGWKINTSPTTLAESELLTKHISNPPCKKFELISPLGTSFIARDQKGVTYKTALDAIHKQYKKKADDELTEPYLLGFYHDEDDSNPTILRIGFGKEGGAVNKKKKGGDK